jgi:putative transcriptional regulator
MKDPLFKDTIILMIEHNLDGAIGLVLNRQINHKINTILTHMELDVKLSNDRPALYGGPVGNGSCFIISKSQYPNAPSESNITLITDLINNELYFELVIGYSGWGAEQLEKEIENGSWFFTDMSTEEMLEIPIEDRYNKALESLGVDPSLLWLPPFQS